MIKAAEVSRRFWEIAGSWLEVERAEHRVSRSLSAAGKGEAAVRHAEECLRLCAENDADAFERFFGYEALARAHRANGDKAAAQAARDQAAKYADRVGDDLKSYCLECLEQLS